MTHEIETQLTRIYEHYSFQLGIIYPPKIAWSKEELYEKYGINPDTFTKGSFGSYFGKENIIYINYEKHQHIQSITETIIHELVHCRFPSQVHTEEFYRIIRDVKNGKSWEVYDKLPDYTLNVISHKISKIRAKMCLL